MIFGICIYGSVSVYTFYDISNIKFCIYSFVSVYTILIFPKLFVLYIQLG